MAMKSRKAPVGSGSSPLIGDALHQRIAERAHELYRGRGERDGDDLKDWYEVEQLVLTEQRAQARTKASRAQTIRRSAGREARLETD